MSIMIWVDGVPGFHTGVGAPRDFPPPPQKLSLFYMIMMLCDGSDL